MLNRTLAVCVAPLLAAGFATPAAAASPAFPPLMVEVHADHPLFLFRAAPEGPDGADAPVDRLTAWWAGLPDRFRPYALVHLAGSGQSWSVRRAYLSDALAAFHERDTRAVAELFTGPHDEVPPVTSVEALFREHANLAGVSVRGLRFSMYSPLREPDLAMPGEVRWFAALVETAARYGRFVLLDLDGLDPARLMANDWARPLHDALRAHHGYVFPLAGHRDGQTIPRQSALLGLWLEGAVAQWGVSVGPGWYASAPFAAPGRLGQARAAAMPPHLYRAMLLNGAMAGAAVYNFTAPGDLWEGEGRARWDDAIAPTLDALLNQRLVPRRDFVARKARVAYRLARAATPADFHLNLRDIDPVFNRGLLVAGAYGMENGGNLPELVPNSGRHYWVPLVSAFAPDDALQSFDRVVLPGHVASASAWTELLDRYHRPDGIGAAFITRVGRAVFIMHTRENAHGAQRFRVPALPRPVRGFEARRNGDGVLVRWPFREGDVAFRVYRRPGPGAPWRLAADNVEQREWRDTEAAPGAGIQYAVTALTNEQAPYEGVVRYGEYLALSTVESRVAEIATLGPLLDVAHSAPAPPSMPVAMPPPEIPSPPGAGQAIAAVTARLNALPSLFAAGDLDGVAGLYAQDYVDASGWGHEYARRTWQWFFERFEARHFLWQARAWEADSETPGTLTLTAFCRARGIAIAGPAGMLADRPVTFPGDGAEVRFVFRRTDGGPWRIVRTEPAFPDMRALLSVAMPPAQAREDGPDVYRRTTAPQERFPRRRGLPEEAVTTHNQEGPPHDRSPSPP